MNILNIILSVLILVTGFLGITVGLLYLILVLIGRILKLCGYYKMFVQTMYELARKGKFRRKNG